MIPLLSVVVAAVAVMGFLVVGLLRAYAEVLRRLSRVEASDGLQPAQDGAEHRHGRERPTLHLPPLRPDDPPAVDIQGVTLQRGPIKIAVGTGTDTLLAFLSSGCMACLPFWEGLREEPDPVSVDVRLVVVTKDPSHESTAKLVKLAAPRAAVVMSSKAWEDYHIEAAPYFIHVDGVSGRVASEGSATSWKQVDSLLQDAILDARYAAGETYTTQSSGQKAVEIA